MKRLIKAEKLNDNLEVLHFSLWFTIIEEDSSKYNRKDMNDTISNTWLTENDINKFLKQFETDGFPVEDIQITAVMDDEITFDVICEIGKTRIDYIINVINNYYEDTETENFGITDECVAVFDEVVCLSK